MSSVACKRARAGACVLVHALARRETCSAAVAARSQWSHPQPGSRQGAGREGKHGSRWRLQPSWDWASRTEVCTSEAVSCKYVPIGVGALHGCGRLVEVQCKR